MQKHSWDYLHIVTEKGRPRYVNGREIPNWQQGPFLFHAMNYLFQHGWEHVDNPFVPDRPWLAYRPGVDHHFRRSRK